jgi:hypothetical protein
MIKTTHHTVWKGGHMQPETESVTLSSLLAITLVSFTFRTLDFKEHFRQWKFVRDAFQDNSSRHEMKEGGLQNYALVMPVTKKKKMNQISY